MDKFSAAFLHAQSESQSLEMILLEGWKGTFKESFDVAVKAAADLAKAAARFKMHIEAAQEQETEEDTLPAGLDVD